MIRQRRKCPQRESEERKYRLKGGTEVRLRKPYSLKKRGKFIDLFRAKERISFFCEGVTAITIERFAFGFEADLQRKNSIKKGEER